MGILKSLLGARATSNGAGISRDGILDVVKPALAEVYILIQGTVAFIHENNDHELLRDINLSSDLKNISFPDFLDGLEGAYRRKNLTIEGATNLITEVRLYASQLRTMVGETILPLTLRVVKDAANQQPKLEPAEKVPHHKVDSDQLRAEKYNTFARGLTSRVGGIRVAFAELGAKLKDAAQQIEIAAAPAKPSLGEAGLPVVPAHIR